MKVYISLPIPGYSYTERRGKAATVYMNLAGKGFKPVNPMNNGLGEHDSREDHMRVDFRLLLDCDAIYLCRGGASPKDASRRRPSPSSAG